MLALKKKKKKSGMKRLGIPFFLMPLTGAGAADGREVAVDMARNMIQAMGLLSSHGDCWSFSQKFSEKVILDRSDNRISAEVVSRPILTKAGEDHQVRLKY